MVLMAAVGGGQMGLLAFIMFSIKIQLVQGGHNYGHNYPSFLQVKATTRLRRIKIAYVRVHGFNPSGIDLLFDGRPVEDCHTPADLDVEDGDVFEAQFKEGAEQLANTQTTHDNEASRKSESHFIQMWCMTNDAVLTLVKGETETVGFRVRPSSIFAELKETYCEIFDHRPDNIHCLYGGLRFAYDTTFASLNIKSLDTLEVDLTGESSLPVPNGRRC